MDRIVMQDDGEKAGTVPGDGRRRVRVLGVDPLGKTTTVELRLPQSLAGRPVKDNDRLCLLCLVGSLQHDLGTDDSWRRVSPTGYRYLPNDVLRGTPVDRGVLVCRDTAVERAAPSGPIVGTNLPGRFGSREQRSRQQAHDGGDSHPINSSESKHCRRAAYRFTWVDATDSRPRIG